MVPRWHQPERITQRGHTQASVWALAEPVPTTERWVIRTGGNRPERTPKLVCPFGITQRASRASAQNPPN
jgi:hypothetical protein